MEQDFVPVGRKRDFSKKPKHPRKEQAAAPAEAPVKEKKEKKENKDGIDENTDICNHCFQSLFPPILFF